MEDISLKNDYESKQVNKKKSPLKNMLARMKVSNESPSQVNNNNFKSPGQSPKGLLNETGIMLNNIKNCNDINNTVKLST